MKVDFKNLFLFPKKDVKGFFFFFYIIDFVFISGLLDPIVKEHIIVGYFIETQYWFSFTFRKTKSGKPVSTTIRVLLRRKRALLTNPIAVEFICLCYFRL